MSEWISVTERLPEKSGVYPACSVMPERRPPEDWVDALCMYDAKAKKGECRWQHSSGFYDNGITHWLELQTPQCPPITAYSSSPLSGSYGSLLSGGGGIGKERMNER